LEFEREPKMKLPLAVLHLEDVEYRVIQPTGEVRTVHSRGEVKRDPSGRPYRMFGTVQDIEALRGMGEGPRELMVSSETRTEVSSPSAEGTAETSATTTTSGPHVLVTVRDKGPGLDPHGLERLFEAFYTTKPQGLAISRSIIHAHGGRLWARANAPQGAVFVFALPIRESS
jgi:signal transduction histidine kinase